MHPQLGWVEFFFPLVPLLATLALAFVLALTLTLTPALTLILALVPLLVLLLLYLSLNYRVPCALHREASIPT